MDRDTAVDIANDWNDNGGRDFGRHYHSLLPALRDYGPTVDDWASDRRPATRSRPLGLDVADCPR